MNAAIYIRKSREEKDKPSHRLTVQREQLPAYAEAQGWSYTVYDDGHASAARGKAESLKERGRLEADIRAGKVDLILTIELSRLSRDDSLQDYVAWLHMCAERRVKLATLSRILDPSQHSDWMLLLMEGGFSSVEMKVLQARMAEGRAQAVLEGKFLGGHVPAPYVHGKAKAAPIIDPEALQRMQRLWSLAETNSTRQIAELLHMPLIAVRRAIADDRLLFYQAKRIGEKGEVIQCEWEPCMTAEQAERIRANRKNRFTGGSRRPAGGLLSNLNLLFCGYCGRSLRAWSNGRSRQDGSRIDYYGCKANELKRTCPPSRLVPQDIMDDKVLTNIFGTLANSDKLRECWEASRESDDKGTELAALDKEETNLQAKKQRLVAAIVEGVIDFADAKAQRTKLDAAISEVARQRAELKASLQLEPEWENLAFTREEFEELSFEDQREFLQLVVSTIRVYASYLIIEYRFPRTMTGDCTARVHLPGPAKRGRKIGKVYTSYPSSKTTT
jgi:site-specific DNA recombinase